MLKSRIAVLALLMPLLATACAAPGGRTSPQEADQVRLVMGYRPDIQFAPMYMAVAEGFDEAQGLELEFHHLPETEAVQLVGVGELPFAIVSGEQVLLARAQGLPVVYVMAWWQDYPVAVAAPENIGIQSPQDLRGKHVGLPGLYGASYIGLRALLDSAGVREDEVVLESIGYTQVESLMQGLVDAIVVYANNEPVQLEAQGVPVTVLPVADYVQLASNGLITNEKTLQENPDLVRRMVAALLGGVEATLEDPARAFEVSKDFVEGLAEADQQVQRGILEASLPFWQSEPLGYSPLQAWANMQEVLLSMGLMESPIEIEDAFTNEFLP